MANPLQYWSIPPFCGDFKETSVRYRGVFIPRANKCGVDLLF